VVDADGRLLGVVRHERALDTAQQEAFEDLQKLVGAGGDERALSPVSVVVRKRLPWLYVNLLTAFLASAVVGLFESTLAAMTALAVLLPIVSGQGGNSGSQTLAIVIRGLALREILPGSVSRVLVKELIAALINGVVRRLGRDPAQSSSMECGGRRRSGWWRRRIQSGGDRRAPDAWPAKPAAC